MIGGHGSFLRKIPKVRVTGADFALNRLSTLPPPLLSMSSRLLSALNDIEQALRKQSAADMGPSWDVTRMVNYHHGLARMTLNPPADAEPDQLRGTIFLQSYSLADGAMSFKASLNWLGCDAFPVMAIYAKPGVDWRGEVARIASAWLAGPPAPLVTMGTPAESHESLVSMAG